MRRAIAAAVTGGLVLGGALAAPAFAAPAGAGRATDQARTAAPAKQAKKPVKAAKAAPATRTVVYQGYEFKVPASWPVYRLDKHPGTCVRYDVHAVYLGTPGADMQCPASLIGRTQTVSFIPGHDAAGRPGGEGASQPGTSDSTNVGRVSAVHAVIAQDTAQDELQVSLGTGSLVGTYGTDPAVIRRVLSTLKQAPAGTAATAQTASAPSFDRPAAGSHAQEQRAEAPAAAVRKPVAKKPAAKKHAAKKTSAKKHAAKKHAANKHAAKKHTAKKHTTNEHAAKKTSAKKTAKTSPTYTNWRGLPAHWPIEVIAPPPAPVPTPTPTPTPPGPSAAVNGFDACTAPSLATMQAWRSSYAAVGIYIGGVNAACGQPDLSASWIESAAAMGYGMLPIYVGPQAPCWSGGNGVAISPSKATAQGAAAAANAVSDAKSYGLAAGSPLYYDMEGYRGSSSCTSTVLTFLGAWDRTVNAAGYLTGVYSSQDSGINDMQSAAAAKTAGFTAPNAIWFADWDNNPTLVNDTPAWPLSDRNKQYQGNVWMTVGHISLSIDEDIVGGPVAH